MKFKNDSLNTKYCVPVDEKTKATLDELKRVKRIDVNAMARDYFTTLIKLVEEQAG